MKLLPFNATASLMLSLLELYRCGPCRAVAPEFEKLANEHGDSCIFLKVRHASFAESLVDISFYSYHVLFVLVDREQVDVDQCRDVASAEKIRAMP